MQTINLLNLLLREQRTAKRSALASFLRRLKKQQHISGKRILLIDDICTTGATLSECARVLKDAGAESVVCAAVAKTREKFTK